MLRIDADSHFTPRDAFDEVGPEFGEMGPRFVELPQGKYRVEYKAREPFVPPHIKVLRGRGTDPREFEVEPRIEAMAREGFATQVLIPNNAPFYYDVDAALGASVSRSFNRAIARILREYPGKFIGVAPVPLQDAAVAIREMEHAMGTLGLHGVIVYQNVNGKDLDGESLWPFYRRAEELGVPILVHGVDSGPLVGVDRFARFNLDVCLGFPVGVLLAIA
jgi:aminocarboxymuconate-semialdehyde decarboxylase